MIISLYIRNVAFKNRILCHANNALAGVQLVHAGRKRELPEAIRWQHTDAISLFKWLAKAIAPGNIAFKEGYEVPLRLDKAGILTGVVGLMTSAQQAEDTLSDDETDLILFTCESLRIHYFTLYAAYRLRDDIEYLVSYLRAKPSCC